MRYTSKLSQADSQEMLSQLIHPSVFTLLEMSNPLPQPEKVQTEDLLTLTYRGNKGHILVRNDGVRILIEAFFGELYVLRAALRDRQLDGSDGTSPLTFFPNADPACNRLPGPGFLAAELSIYSWDPSTYLAGLDVHGTVGHFIADPDFYLWKNFDPQIFFKLWEQAFFLGRAPWQTARPMSGVATFFVKQSAALLKKLGYHRVDAVPSWFNVARFFNKLGYKFTYGEHQVVFETIEKGLKAFRALDSGQQSWLVSLQNIPGEYLPDALKLPARWPVTHTNSYWVRMHLELNPYPALPKPGSELTDRIANLRNPVQPEAEAHLHTAGNCPCMDSIGASSPAATSPAATPGTVHMDSAEPETTGGGKQQ